MRHYCYYGKITAKVSKDIEAENILEVNKQIPTVFASINFGELGIPHKISITINQVHPYQVNPDIFCINVILELGLKGTIEADSKNTAEQKTIKAIHAVDCGNLTDVKLEKLSMYSDPLLE